MHHILVRSGRAWKSMFHWASEADLHSLEAHVARLGFPKP